MCDALDRRNFLAAATQKASIVNGLAVAITVALMLFNLFGKLFAVR